MTITPAHKPLTSSGTVFQQRFLMKTLSLRQRLGQRPNRLEQGFTLIELLVVIVILGTLAAIALPAFLQQADKGKLNGAKTLALSSARECQVWLVEQETTAFARTTGAGSGITLAGSTCDATGGGAFTATIIGGKNDTKTCTATVSAGTGAVSRSGNAVDVGNVLGCDNNWS